MALRSPASAQHLCRHPGELHDMFIAEAAADARPPAEVLHDLIRDYVDRRRQARDYDDFLRRKVELGRMDRDAGRHVSNDEAEAEAAAARREKLLQRTAAAMTGELAQATGTSSGLC
jgi:uncharacterized protein YcbX